MDGMALSRPDVGDDTFAAVRQLRDVTCARVHTPQPDSAHVAAGRAALGQ